MQRSFEQIFGHIENQQETKYNLKCSFFEIYNEQIIDLLSSSQNPALAVREDQIQGMTYKEVKNYSEVEQLISEGSKNRHVGATRMN